MDRIAEFVRNSLATLMGKAPAGSATGSPPAAPAWGAEPRPTPASLCAAITVADFRAVGLQPDLDAPVVNPADDGDGGAGAYCSYTRASVAAGGIEFDVFYDDDPLAVQRTILGEGGGAVTPASLEGADECLLGRSTMPGEAAHASIVVRRANCVFTIAIPDGPDAAEQLRALARLALQRLPA
ncbi:MAG TPA: hypothetical protein VFL91_01055 [Thermomicrobiales bacterium]|nr:hypothetical protein [Thermomicrobiales bacterium]